MIQCSIYKHDIQRYTCCTLRDTTTTCVPGYLCTPGTTCTHAPISHARVYTCTTVVCTVHVCTGIPVLPVVPNTSFNPYMYLVY